MSAGTNGHSRAVSLATEGQLSRSSSGECFPLPADEEESEEVERVERLAESSRAAGREIVVVVGLGFVGAVMAAVVADAKGRDGEPSKLVIGLDRRLDTTYWKIALLNRGEPPVNAEDPEIAAIIARCVREKKTLTATWVSDALGLADVIVVDVQCEYVKRSFGNVRDGYVDMRALEEVFETIGERAPPGALILIETTVAPGTTEQVALPIITRAFERRGIGSQPILAHSYERVMPGRSYVASVRDFWRVCSGVTPEARRRVEGFLRSVLDTERYPLTVLERPIESETAKIIENGYRATILAFMDEWSNFAEQNGIDLKRVIEAIKLRPTHSNILFPGPGIGGYCLPKDGGLGIWAHRHILGWEDDIFRMTPLAIDINDARALHVSRLVRAALREMGESIVAAGVLVLGVSYREDVGDTRSSASVLIARSLASEGAALRAHDPYVKSWPAVEEQGAPLPQAASERRGEAPFASPTMEPDLWAAMEGAKAIILAVRHAAYLELEPDEVYEAVGKPFALIDCFMILDDARIRRYLELGCEVKALGRGHIGRIKQSIRGGSGR